MGPLKRILFNGLLALCLGACDCDSSGSEDTVVTRANPEADFDSYQTFRIVDELTLANLEDAGVNTGLIPDDVLLNVDIANDQARIELEALGLTQVSGDTEADLGVVTMASTGETGGTVWECVPGYWYGYWDYYWDPCAWLVPVYVEYTVGSLFVGLADPSLEAVAFGGVLQGVVNDSGRVEDRIRSGVHAMFQQYPK
jgi:hypothetical protein